MAIIALIDVIIFHTIRSAAVTKSVEACTLCEVAAMHEVDELAAASYHMRHEQRPAAKGAATYQFVGCNRAHCASLSTGAQQATIVPNLARLALTRCLTVPALSTARAMYFQIVSSWLSAPAAQSEC